MLSPSPNSTNLEIGRLIKYGDFLKCSLVIKMNSGVEYTIIYETNQSYGLKK